MECIESESSSLSPFLFLFLSVLEQDCILSLYVLNLRDILTTNFDHTCLQCLLALRLTTSMRSRTASGKRSTTPKKTVTALYAISLVKHAILKCILQTTWTKRLF